MNRITEFLGYSIPWEAWLFPGAAVLIALFFFLSRIFGIRNAAYAVGIAAVGVVTAILDRRGRQSGWEERIAKEKRDADRMVERAERARDDVLAADPKRLRDDDGFKRH